MRTTGPIYALAAATLFGISPPLAKLIIGEMSPALLAGLLYLGSGLGLFLVLLRSKKEALTELRRIRPRNRLKLLGAIFSGGIIAPLFLAYGIRSGTAFEVSLLLNLESFTTTILARFIFKEHVGRSVWAGKLLLLFGGMVICYDPKSPMALSFAGLMVFLACLFWGVDNNLTRDVEDLSPTVLACTKGWISGALNTALALSLGAGTATLASVVGTLTIGAFCYGLSLVLFIFALRDLGAARTSTYFSTGPFFGMFFSLILLGEKPAPWQWFASGVMAIGLWILSRESHEHLHTHEPTFHNHKHVHDEHHQHTHEGWEGAEPHEHPHLHEPITHSHPHWPDIHHRHSHEQ